LRTIRYESDELVFRKIVLWSQIQSIAVLVFAGVFVWLVGYISPGFFQHPNLTWRVPEGVVIYFWPLLFYGAVMAIVSVFASDLSSEDDDEAVFGLSLLSSILAGVWEEIGYRWLYICTAMVSLVFLNWILGTVVGTILALVLLVFGLAMFVTRGAGNRVFGGIVTIFALFVIYILWYMGYDNPVYWVFENITVPVVNFVTLGSFEMVFNNPNLSQLFVFGIIAANANFRDGHKYQGPVGMANAWVIGFVMMYATIFYGIGTAIVLHVLYDIEFAVIRYVGRKLRS